MANKNLKKNTGETVKKNTRGAAFIKEQKAKVKKQLETTAKKLKTAKDLDTPKRKALAKKYQAAEVKATNAYLKDLSKSVKGIKGGTQRGRALASQHKTRATLIGRKLNKLKSGLSISAKNR